MRRAARFSNFDASKQVRITKRRPFRPSDEEAARNSANVSAFNQHFRHTSPQIIILVCYCNKHPQRHDCQLRPSPPQLSSIPRATSCRASTPLPTTFSQPGLSQPAILPTHFGPPPPLDLLAAGPHLIPGPPLPAEPLATITSPLTSGPPLLRGHPLCPAFISTLNSSQRPFSTPRPTRCRSSSPPRAEMTRRPP